MNNEISYSLRVDYEERTENPGRIFRSMGSLIESFRFIDLMFAESIDSDLESRQFLESIEAGSLITRIIEIFTDSTQRNIGKELEPESVENYIDKGKQRIIETMNENNTIADGKIINDLSEGLQKIAQDSGVDAHIRYKKIESLTLASNLESLSNSTKSLSEGENITYEKQDNIISINKNCELDLDKIQEDLVAEIRETDTIRIFKIKKPDFLGNSMWELKHGTQTIRAKITDGRWLKRFRDGEISTRPGDAIRSKIKELHKYDENGNLVSSYHEIYEIIEIIGRGDDTQLTLEE